MMKIFDRLFRRGRGPHPALATPLPERVYDEAKRLAERHGLDVEAVVDRCASGVCDPQLSVDSLLFDEARREPMSLHRRAALYLSQMSAEALGHKDAWVVVFAENEGDESWSTDVTLFGVDLDDGRLVDEEALELEEWPDGEDWVQLLCSVVWASEDDGSGRRHMIPELTIVARVASSEYEGRTDV